MWSLYEWKPVKISGGCTTPALLCNLCLCVKIQCTNHLFKTVRRLECWTVGQHSILNGQCWQVYVHRLMHSEPLRQHLSCNFLMKHSFIFIFCLQLTCWCGIIGPMAIACKPVLACTSWPTNIQTLKLLHCKSSLVFSVER